MIKEMCHNFTVEQKRVFYAIQFFVLHYDCRQDSVRIPAKYRVRINYRRILQNLTAYDFFLWGFVKDNVLRPTTSKDTTRIARAHQHRKRERPTRHA